MSTSLGIIGGQHAAWQPLDSLARAWRHINEHEPPLPANLSHRIPGHPPGTIPIAGWYAQAQVHWRCTQPGLMALTFDDAPGVYDDELVAALHELRVPATFFAVGSYALHTGSIGLTRLLAAGHQVGFHSFSHVKLKHPVPTGATFYDHEIDDTEAAFRQLLGGAELPRYIRPVGLHLDEPVAYELRRRGYEVVMGTINLKDWSGVPPSDMLAALRASVRRTGAAASHIVVLHVGLNATIPWLHAAVPRMRRLGFRFVRVDECLGYPDRPRQTTKI